ncbi:hypothetical protein ACLMJK_001363 [Lecanora helva]
MGPAPDSYSPAEKVLVYQIRILFPEWTWAERAEFFNLCKLSNRPVRSSAGIVQAWARMKQDQDFMREVSSITTLLPSDEGL